MTLYLLIPLLLGALSVFQPVLNRMMADSRGLTIAVWFNSLILFTMASLAVFWVHFFSEKFPEYIRPKFNDHWNWWYLLPGVMGFLIVLNLPLAMRSMGAFTTIIGLLLGQLLTSFAYDAYTSGQMPSLSRALGLAFAIVGVYLSFRPAN